MSSGGTKDALEEAKTILSSRRVRERLLHLSYYKDEDPGESLMRGLELSAAALQSRSTEE